MIRRRLLRAASWLAFRGVQRQVPGASRALAWIAVRRLEAMGVPDVEVRIYRLPPGRRFPTSTEEE